MPALLYHPSTVRQGIPLSSGTIGMYFAAVIPLAIQKAQPRGVAGIYRLPSEGTRAFFCDSFGWTEVPKFLGP